MSEGLFGDGGIIIIFQTDSSQTLYWGYIEVSTQTKQRSDQYKCIMFREQVIA